MSSPRYNGGINPPAAGVLSYGRRAASSHGIPPPFRPFAGHRLRRRPDTEFAQAALAHIDSLYGTALRLTRRAPDAEDLVQDTYLKAFRVGSPVRARDEPQGVAVHHPPQHVSEHPPARRPQPGGCRQRGGRARGQTTGPADAVAGADSDAGDARRGSAGGARRAARRVPAGGLAAGRRRAVVRGDGDGARTCRSGTVMSRISRGRRALSEGLRARRAGRMPRERRSWSGSMADDIKNCGDLDERLAPYVDGEETPDARRAVEAHLAALPAVPRARRTPSAPRATSCTSIAPRSCPRPRGAPRPLRRAPILGRHSSIASRQSPVCDTAPVGAVVARGDARPRGRRRLRLRAEQPRRGARGQPRGRSREVLQGERRAGRAPSRRSRSASGSRTRAGRLSSRRASPAQQLKLVDVRRCFSTDGRAAHMMYTGAARRCRSTCCPRNVGRDRVVEKMGQQAVIWCANRPDLRGRRRRAVRQDLTRVVDYMKAHVR